MERCEVLIIGGGPAGSTCARKLSQAGLDVLLLDKELFPRSKPCAGWITPAVLATLEIDRDEYGSRRVLQEIDSFCTALMDGPEVLTRYDRTVSYGIRRCEFDQYLLERSGVRQIMGEPVADLARHDGGWLVNGRIRARLVVGAGGHFCPVARLLGARIVGEEAVVAQVAEFALNPDQERRCSIPGETPALYFSRDLKGYGWLFRKGRFLNVGLGRRDREHLGWHMRNFLTFLERRGALPSGGGWRLQGHAYRLYSRQGGRRSVGEGALLIGDAAGLSCPRSGEGILPAVESALLAAETVLKANGDYRRDNLEPYAARLAAHFGSGRGLLAAPLVSALLGPVSGWLLSSGWFTRHLVLDRGFLHTGKKGLNWSGNQ